MTAIPDKYPDPAGEEEGVCRARNDDAGRVAAGHPGLVRLQGRHRSGRYRERPGEGLAT